MQYSTLEKYQLIYLDGSEQVIPDNEFSLFARKASNRIGAVDLAAAGISTPIDYILSDGSILEIDYPYELIMATCEIATALFEHNETTRGGLIVTSESEKMSTFTKSVGYGETKGEVQSIDTIVDNTISDWVAFTPLHNQLITPDHIRRRLPLRYIHPGIA